MTNEEAEELRRQLCDHYHDQLLTVREFCSMLRTWSDAARDYLRIAYGVADPDRIFLAADKSSLLGRLFYGKEKLRTQPCPKHKGVWSGCFIDCPCGGTGWLPEE